MNYSIFSRLVLGFLSLLKMGLGFLRDDGESDREMSFDGGKHLLEKKVAMPWVFLCVPANLNIMHGLLIKQL